MTEIADKIYAATGLTLNAEAAAKIGQMIQQARRDALKEAWLVIAGKSVLETPASFEDILQRDVEIMNDIRALGEKE
jgi:urease gamma subunit